MRRREYWEVPHTMRPGEKIIDVPVISNFEVAIWVGRLGAYPVGFELEINIAVPDERAELMRDLLAGFAEPRGQRGAIEFAIRFADGRVGSTAETLATLRQPNTKPEPAVSFVPLHGTGGSGRYAQCYWIRPLPPLGPVIVELRWPPRIPSRAIQLDGKVIRDTANRAERLFGLPSKTPAE